MSTKIELTALLITLFLSFTACKEDTQYTPVNKSTTSTKKDFLPKTNSFKSDVHTVVVNEVLKTKKYLYINVTEKGNPNPFWIATRIVDVKVGGIYFYKGGLLKTNFESKEFNRVFDKIYLVSSNLVPANHASNPMFRQKIQTNKKSTSSKKTPQKTTVAKIKNTKAPKGTIKIAYLVKNAQKLAGKTVQISGTCTKINAGIMNRNWIHIADGSKDDYDLVVTAKEFVKEGDKVTIKAVVVLNKDFGAGYVYDLILENGKIIH